VAEANELSVVSAEDAQGRVLSGVGTTTEALEKTMERHAPDVPAASEPAEPRQTRGQKRFDQLTKERETYREQAEAAARERDDLRQKLDAASRPVAPAPVAMPASVPPAPAASALPATRELLAKMPVELKTFEAYTALYPDADYEDWRDGRNFWINEQQLATNFDARIRQSIEADRASRTTAEHVQKASERAKTRYADFDTVLQAPHMQAQNWPGEKIQAIARLEEPEHIQYALAKDPALAERLRTADPVTFGMELARLIPASAVALPASTAGAGTVNAPPPPFQPVGAGSKTTAPPLADLTKKAGFDFDKSGYRERRAAERGVTRRR
jgi:predicted secreted protein